METKWLPLQTLNLHTISTVQAHTKSNCNFQYHILLGDFKEEIFTFLKDFFLSLFLANFSLWLFKVMYCIWKYKHHMLA